MNKSAIELCVDTECIMFLIDRQFLKKYRSDLKIQEIQSKITIKNIDAQIHESSQFVILKFLISETKKNKKKCMTRIIRKFHLINDLKIKALIGMNILKPEKMTIDLDRRRLTIDACDELKTSIQITPRKIRVNRAVRIAKQVTIFAFFFQLMQIKLRKTSIFQNRDYSFCPKSDIALKENEEVVASICDANIAAIEVKNATDKSYLISRNLKMRHLQNFDEEKAYQTDSKKHHRATVSFKI